MIIIKLGITSFEEHHPIYFPVASFYRLKNGKYNKNFLRHRKKDTSHVGSSYGDIAAKSRMGFIAMIMSSQQVL